jgi:hypothetical protein
MTINKIEIVESDLSVVVTSPGPQGTAGKTVLGGDGVPSDELGIDGDFYIDTNASNIYGPKANGSWGSPRSLLGTAATIAVGTTTSVPNSGTASVTNSGTTNAATFDFVLRDGADGKSVLSGSGVPSAGLGVDGDFYIDTSSDTIYGPKAGGTWGAATSLVGPQGIPGKGVASGGTVGQVLVKSSSVDYATGWGDAISSGVSVPDGATVSVLGLPGVTIHSIGSISLADGLTQLYGPFFVDRPIDVAECAIEVTTPWAGGAVSLHLIQADEDWQPINGTDVTVAASVDCSTAGIKLVAGLSLNLERGRWLTVLKETVDGAGTLRGFSGAPPGVSFFSDTFSAIDASGFWRKLSPTSLADKWSRATYDIDDRGFQQPILLKWNRPFSVLDSLNPVMWLDASDASTITLGAGSLVTTWADKSGNGYDMAQGTVTYQPDSGTRTLNGLNVLDFDNDNMENVTVSTSNQSVVFMVSDDDVITGTARYHAFGLTSASPTVGILGGTQYRIGQGTVLDQGTAATGVKLWRAVFDTTDTLHVDQVSEISGNAGTNAMTGLRIGSLGGATYGINAALAEIIIVDGTLTAQQISDAETYLANKWGIGPGKVGVVTTTAGSGEVLLSWSAPDSILPVTDYIVEYSTDDVNWTTFVDAVSAATTATVTGLMNSTLYYFRVAAVNNGGTGEFSDSVTATPILSPLDLSPLAWYDASDTGTITESGGAVSQWDDKSGNGYDLTQLTSIRQPKTGTATLNSLNTVEFDNTTSFQHLFNTSIDVSSGNHTFFLVIDIAAGDTDHPLLTSGTLTGGYAYLGSQGSSSTAISNWTTTSLHVDSVLQTPTTRDDVYTALGTGPGLFRVVAQANVSGMSYGYGQDPFDWDYGTKLAEVIIVDGTLSAQQISDTETYLADKWGITL